MFRMQTAASRRRERGTATHSAIGARPAPTSTTGRGILARRRTTGRATPVATRTQAVARMPLGARKGGEYMDWAPRSPAGLAAERPPLAEPAESPVIVPTPAGAGRIKAGPAELECRALRSDASDAKRRRRVPKLLT